MNYTFIHINKTGGTTISEILGKIRAISNGNSRFPSNIHFGIIHDNIGEIKNIENTNNLIFFTRDPISRFIAGYNFSDNILNDRKDLNELLSKRDLQEILNKNPHAYTNTTYFFPNYEKIVEKIFFVGKYETFEKDIKRLYEIFIKADNKISIPRLNKSEKNGKYLLQDNINFLRDFYKDEYAFFQNLVNDGFIDQEYLNSCKNRTEYMY